MKKLLISLLAVLSVPVALAEDAAPPKKIGWVDAVEIDLEGWKVFADPKLLEGEHTLDGRKAIDMLRNHLQRIAILVPEPVLSDLKKVAFQLEYEHPELEGMQYHPDGKWLADRGYDPSMSKKVHICKASLLYSRKQMLKHPAVILHELAHAYHDQVLSFDHPEILAAYDAAMKAEKYKKVLLYDGREVEHYAATDHKEYFAEATEAYFYRNDFFPFVSAELKPYDPQVYALMEKIWGKK